jgi:glucose/arabinose dehydrogenase
VIAETYTSVGSSGRTGGTFRMLTAVRGVMSPSRRRFLRNGLLACAVGIAGCSTGAPSREEDGGTGGGGTSHDSETSDRTRTASRDGVRVNAERVAAGFVSPLGIEVVDGDVYVVDQPGRIYRVGDGGPSTFLDLRGRVVDVSGYDERGLLGLAFHPDYPDDPRLYVRYSAPSGSETDHTFVLSEFRADDDGVDSDSERRLLELPQPQMNHNAGTVVFGPDGYLYVATGDGGGGNDRGEGHVDDWYDRNAGGNGQDVTENLLGSILRLDVDGETDGKPYGVPDDNPLVGEEGLDEQWAWGFRNPWRMSFAGEDLFVADVGQNLYEEVNLVTRGGNYGWNVREATHCFSTDSPGDPPASCPSETPDGDPLVGPIIEYGHGGPEPSGIAVIGGYRYEGEELPELRGTYVFADWHADGNLFVASPRDEGVWPVSVVPMGGDVGGYLLGFGRDGDGELLVATSKRGAVAGETGTVHRLRAP